MVGLHDGEELPCPAMISRRVTPGYGVFVMLTGGQVAIRREQDGAILPEHRRSVRGFAIKRRPGLLLNQPRGLLPSAPIVKRPYDQGVREQRRIAPGIDFTQRREEGSQHRSVRQGQQGRLSVVGWSVGQRLGFAPGPAFILRANEHDPSAGWGDHVARHAEAAVELHLGLRHHERRRRRDVPVAGIEGDQQGPTIQPRDASPGHTSPKTGKRVWLLLSRANDYPAHIRGPGSGLATLYDPYRHDRQRLTLWGSRGRRRCES